MGIITIICISTLKNRRSWQKDKNQGQVNIIDKKNLLSNTPKNADLSETLYQAWIYPGEPACNVINEIADGRKVHILKPEYATLDSHGALKFINAEEGCNGFSAENLAYLKKHSQEQYMTVSGHLVEMAAFFSHTSMLSENIKKLVDFVVTNNMTGVELDFEDFSAWSNIDYQNYLKFVAQLGQELAKHDKKLMIDGPAIANSEQQGWYKWKYEDFNSLPVSYIVVMAYDYQADQGVGQPISPIKWVEESAKWALAKMTDDSKLVIGLPSYGYEGVLNSYTARILTKSQMEALVDLGKLIRDEESKELIGTINNKTYVLNDRISLDSKLQILRGIGINNVSVWHLGGNDWFSN